MNPSEFEVDQTRTAKRARLGVIRHSRRPTFRRQRNAESRRRRICVRRRQRRIRTVARARTYLRADRPTTVPADVPSDVRAVLTQLFEEGVTAVEAGDYGTARQVTETARTVCRTKLPVGQRRSRLLHGCDRVLASLGRADGVDADTSAEYLRAMARRLPDR